VSSGVAPKPFTGLELPAPLQPAQQLIHVYLFRHPFRLEDEGRA